MLIVAVELSAMLLDVMLETHAWAAARPKHESQIAVQKFEKKISEVMDVEKQQGMLASFSISSFPSIIFGAHMLSLPSVDAVY